MMPGVPNRISGLDGREWWVGRRWLPWRPRMRDVDAGDPNLFRFADGADDVAGCLIGIALAALLLFAPILAILLLAVEWVLVLALLPLWALAHLAAGSPWRVVARGRTADGRRVRHYGRVRGWRAASALIATVREEIRVYGEPRSLSADPPDRQPPAGARRGLAAGRVPPPVAVAGGWVGRIGGDRCHLR